MLQPYPTPPPPVTETGNPHGNAAIPLSNPVPLVWGPLTLTNYDVDFNSGAGSLTLAAGGSMVGSSLMLPGAGQDLVNNGTLLVNNSTVSVGGKLSQSSSGQIDIMGNGHVTLAGSEDGGGIAINSGMLEFARAPGFVHGAETSSGNCTDWLAFTGMSGALKFDGISGKLSIAYNASLDDLIVRTPVNGTIGIFQLAASAQGYSQAEFSVHGNEVMYQHISQA